MNCCVCKSDVRVLSLKMAARRNGASGNAPSIHICESCVMTPSHETFTDLNAVLRRNALDAYLDLRGVQKDTLADKAGVR